MAESQQSWMIYGANGYTGRLMAHEAARRGLRPILAGRNAEAIREVAEPLGFEAVAFGLEEPGLVDRLRKVSLVLNSAGPFARTAPRMMKACLDAKAHYLDITGEIPVIEQAAALDAQAREAGVTLMPAVGFDVVPSDCLAKALAERLPGATHLTLAFTDTSTMSPGTAKTVLLGMPRGGVARIDGKLEGVPVAWKEREIPFRDRPRPALSIGWGDVASAYYSTGIPNIETYTAIPRQQAAWLRRLRRLLPLLAFPPITKLVEGMIGRRVPGPTDEERERSRAQLWGEVRDASGRSVTGTLETPGGYKLTPLAAVTCAQRTLAGEAPTGFSTPAQAFGANLILTIPGTDMQIEGP